MADRVHINGLNTYLSSQAVNTKEHPYYIDVTYANNSNLEGTIGTPTDTSTLQYILRNNPDKYVSITLMGNTYTKISDYGLYGCETLVEIEFYPGLTEIGKQAFQGCSNLITCLLDNTRNLTKIGDYAFHSCTSLPSIKCVSKEITLGQGIFWGCTSLRSAIFKNYSSDNVGLTVIPAQAFQNCSALLSEYLQIPDTVTEIHSQAFLNCTSLTSFELKNIQVLSDTVFMGCSALTTVSFNNCSFTEIENNCFRDCVSLESIQLFNGITQIGQTAFTNCTSLKKINIPKSVTTILNGAFADSGLVEIEISNNVSNTDYNTGWFSNCVNLELAIIDSSRIGSNCFLGCTSLKKITIGSNVKAISSYAFRNCSNLIEVNYLGSIDDWVKMSINVNGTIFDKNVNSQFSTLVNNELKLLEYAVISENITQYALYGYKQLKMLKFSGNSIHSTALRGCTGLETVELTGNPTNLTSVFKDLTGLKTVYNIPSSVTALDTAFDGCFSLESIHNWEVDPDNVTMTNCFRGCSSLSDIFVKLPDITFKSNKWKLLEFTLNNQSATLNTYNTDLDEGDLDLLRTATISNSNTKDLTLFDVVDELAAASDITEAELKQLLEYKYKMGLEGEGLSPQGNTFVLWASDDDKINTNLFNAIQMTDSEFEEVL